MKLYEQLANTIAESIQQGVLCRGDKLPSISHTSHSRNISPSTVFQAYYLLEARGLISAHECSGYFVTGGAIGISPSPEPKSEVNEKSTQVDVSEVVFKKAKSLFAKCVMTTMSNAHDQSIHSHPCGMVSKEPLN